MTTSIPPAAQAPRPWRTGILAGMASYLDAGTLVATGSALVLYQPALKLNDSAIGILSGLITLSFAMGAIVGGRLGDRFGRRRVFTISLVLYALGIATLTAAVHAVMLYVGVVLAGISIGADMPVSLALIAEEAPEGIKGRLVVFSNFLSLVGIVVTIILTVIVGDLGALGARILYGHLLLVAAVVLVLRLGLPESREWLVAQQQQASGDDDIRLGALPQLFSPPLLFTMLALGLYYAMWGLAANTIGQFMTYMWVNLAGGTVQGAGLVGLSAVPCALGAALLFMRVVDRPSRWFWFSIGTACHILAFALPALAGVSMGTLIACQLLFAAGTGFAGETIYKVWSQELLPTLLRSTGQGLTVAIHRISAALFAFVTPALLLTNSRLFFGLLLASALITALVGLLWVPRLPKAVMLEPAEAALATEPASAHI